MRVVVHVDGGARGNPGPAAVGAVAAAPEGDVLAERGAYIGETTNNVAEYRALLLGLELARELGADEVEVINDSELVAKQISGQYSVKNAGLKPLYLEAMAALRGLRELEDRERSPGVQRTGRRARERDARRSAAALSPCTRRVASSWRRAAPPSVRSPTRSWRRPPAGPTGRTSS